MGATAPILGLDPGASGKVFFSFENATTIAEELKARLGQTTYAVVEMPYLGEPLVTVRNALPLEILDTTVLPRPRIIVPGTNAGDFRLGHEEDLVKNGWEFEFSTNYVIARNIANHTVNTRILLIPT